MAKRRPAQPSYEREAKRRWPRAKWISGEGPYAVLAPCDGRLTVSLHATAEAARKAKGSIDYFACGGGCRKELHQLVEIPQR